MLSTSLLWCCSFFITCQLKLYIYIFYFLIIFNFWHSLFIYIAVFFDCLSLTVFDWFSKHAGMLQKYKIVEKHVILT